MTKLRTMLVDVLAALEYHPAAAAFPMMDEKHFDDLKKDIGAVGLRQPITLCEGKILDGRNRAKACAELSLPSSIHDYQGDPWAYVWSLNGARRDLGDEQRYLIWRMCQEHSEEFQAEAKRIQEEANKKRSEAAMAQPRTPDGTKLAEKQVRGHSVRAPARTSTDPGRKAKANASKSNAGAVARGDRLIKLRPDLAEAVRSGKMSASAANKTLQKQVAAEKREAVSSSAKDDEDRLKALDIKVQPYDVWNFANCHLGMGAEHPGRIPGQLVCHALYFFTKPGDVVVDPMVGSGTTLDACHAMGRQGFGYDIENRHARGDVTVYAGLPQAWPEPASQAALVFWDPPYFAKMDQAAIGTDGYHAGSISRLSPSAYLEWISTALCTLRKAVRPGAILAFLMSDWDPENAAMHADCPGIFLWDYAASMQAAGWTMRRQIQCPPPTQQLHADMVTKFRAARRLGRLERYLLIAENAS